MEQSTSNAKEILKKYWGYASFRPLQAEIIDSVIDGRDTMALLPTGGGKSICYQVPAMMTSGITIVISPLIALMKDQVKNLENRGIKAIAIYSGMHPKEIDRLFDQCVYGDVKLLYLSPERLQTPMAVERLKKMKIDLIAVDEAHCISQWGHDFRPSYLEIAKIKEWHPSVPFLALTATATQIVRDEIEQFLQLNNVNKFVQSFARENLNYLVFKTEDKLGKLRHILKSTNGSAIVYARSRRKTKELADLLSRNGVGAQAYHAGLKMGQRNEIQANWIAGRVRVIVATNAFGMGIDKPDVRVVVHYELPPTLEEYYQEAGRAGRDGLTGYCVILCHQSDIEKQMEFNQQRFPTMPEIRRVYKALQLNAKLPPGSGLGYTIPFELVPFCKQYSLEVNRTFHALKILDQDGWLTISESVYHQSRLRFIVGKEHVYDYQLKNEAQESLIQLLLRGYEGLFLESARIDEGRLANRLNTSKEKVSDLLQKLHRDGIADYQPSSEAPQLTFLRSRVEDQNLSIDMDKYRMRKDRAFAQLKSLIEYLDSDHCRENELLKYFDEDKQEECGHCDLCRKRAKQQVPSQQEILNRIPEGGIRLIDLLKTFTAIHENHIRSMIQYLEGEKIVLVKYDRIFLAKK